MDYEYYLSKSYAPMKAIVLLSDMIYEKSNNEWSIFSMMTREQGEELLAINYAIKLCAAHLLKKRQEEVDNIM